MRRLGLRPHTLPTSSARYSIAIHRLDGVWLSSAGLSDEKHYKKSLAYTTVSFPDHVALE